MLDVKVAKQLGHTHFDFAFSSPALKTVVFGPSGCGKTTLLKILAGLSTPDRGSFCFNAQTIIDIDHGVAVPAHQRNFGYLPQKSCLFPHMNVAQNIHYGLRYKRVKKAQEMVHIWAERLGITELLQRYPAQLSGGQQQRVALARVFASRPKLLLLDEPFSALDVSVREELRDLLIALIDECHIPTLLVTHDREEAFVFGEHMVVMQAGEVIEAGALEDVFHAPRLLDTAKMLGFDNRWKVVEQHMFQVLLDNNWQLNCAVELPFEVTHICIRPEDVMILRPDRPVRQGLQDNVFAVTIEGIYPRGRHYKLTVIGADQEALSINIPAHAFQIMNLHQGQHINISLKKQALVGCSTHPDLTHEVLT
ncbi:MAG: ABC transporter ATP-binding protein [Desulfuromonadaceae bacterium]